MYWQFFYRPPGKFQYNVGEIAKKIDAKNSLYIDIIATNSAIIDMDFLYR